MAGSETVAGAKIRLAEEIQTYSEIQDDLVRDYHRKVFVVKGRRVIGPFNSEADADRYGRKHIEDDSFLIAVALTDEESISHMGGSSIRFESLDKD